MSQLLEYDVYNVCSQTPLSVRQFAYSVADLIGKPRDLLKWGRIHREHEPPWVVGNSMRFRQVTGWEPKYDITSGISKALQSYKVTN